MSEPLLSFDDVQVSFATEFGTVDAVRGVSFSLDPGEVVAVVGESGSGKSVTSSTAMGLLPGNATISGSVRLLGRDVLSMPDAQMRSMRGRDVSMVFQEPMTALNPVLKIGDQLVEALQVHDVAYGDEAMRRAVELLEQVGIEDAARRVRQYPHQFSGGQRQRIVIAMAIACGPQVIIADEPTTALDVTVQAEILDLLRRLKDDLDTGILLITHNMGVVADMADRVVVMYDGQVVETGAVDQILRDPQHPYTQRLLAAMPRLQEGDGSDDGSDDASAGREPGNDDGASGGGVEAPAENSSIRVDEPAPVVGGESAGRSEAPALEARGLALEYSFRRRRTRVVEGVDFSVDSGEILGLVGESGSGKSTVAKAVLGLLGVAEGELLVRGRNLPKLPRREKKALRREIGVVFQDPAASLDPRFPIGDVITEPMVVHKVGDRSSQLARARELLDAVHLPASVLNRYPHELSGGQRQRISIARALTLSPTLLVADEPTSALDVSVQASVLEMFRELQEQYSFACLFVSHDLAVVDSLAHKVLVMQKGRTVEQGSTDQVLRHAREDYTRRLLAAAPVPDPAEQARRREERRRMLAVSGESQG